jgi:hypothetical protein
LSLTIFVTSVAQRLQFAKAKRLMIAFVRGDLIDDARKNDLSLLKAHFAEGILLQLRPRHSLPAPFVVPLLCHRPVTQ